jgi:hypothetical protein
MAKVINTADTMKESLTAGEDKHFEIKKNDEPLKVIDQSKTVSTRTMIPNKRPVEKKDINKMVNRLKGDGLVTKTGKVKAPENVEPPKEDEKPEKKKRGRPKRKNK